MRSLLAGIAVVLQLLAACAAIGASVTFVRGSLATGALLLLSAAILVALGTALKALRLRYPAKPADHRKVIPAAPRDG
jgi:hypothetical protein